MSQNNFYSELYERYSDYIDAFNSIFQITSNDKNDIYNVFQKIKTILIEKYEIMLIEILDSIDKACIYRKKYVYSYWNLLELIYNEYSEMLSHQIKNENNCLFYKFFLKSKIDGKSFDLSDFIIDPIEEIIMTDDLERFIEFSESSNFDINIKINPGSKDIFRHYFFNSLNLLEYCSMNGSQKIFKYLRSMYSFQISILCYELSFLGGDPFILKECQSCHNATIGSLTNAIISHNFDFVIFLMNNYNFKVNYWICTYYYNFQALLLFLDKNKDIVSAFQFSPWCLIQSFCKYIIERLEVNDFNENVNITLYFATKWISVKPIQILLNNGATVLHYAVENSNFEVIKYLVENGADVNAKDNTGQTPLYIAAGIGNENIIKYLIENGSDANARNKTDETPLHKAVSSGIIKAVQVLLEHRVEIDPVSIYNQTPLQIAVSYSHYEIASCLINNGADVHRKDRNEWNIIRVVRFPTIGVLEDLPGVIIVSLNQKFYFGVSFIDFSIKNISKTRK